MQHTRGETSCPIKMRVGLGGEDGGRAGWWRWRAGQAGEDGVEQVGEDGGRAGW